MWPNPQLQISQISQEIPVLESLINKVVGLNACNLIKKRLKHRYFPVKFVKFLRTPILKTSANDCFWMQYFNHGNQAASKIDFFP